MEERKQSWLPQACLECTDPGLCFLKATNGNTASGPNTAGRQVSSPPTRPTGRNRRWRDDFIAHSGNRHGNAMMCCAALCCALHVNSCVVLPSNHRSQILSRAALVYPTRARAQGIFPPSHKELLLSFTSLTLNSSVPWSKWRLGWHPL